MGLYGLLNLVQVDFYLGLLLALSEDLFDCATFYILFHVHVEVFAFLLMSDPVVYALRLLNYHASIN